MNYILGFLMLPLLALSLLFLALDQKWIPL